MIDLPYESLLGISYGLLAGFVPALAVGTIAIVVGLVRDRPIPVATGLVVVPLAIATVAAAGVVGSGPTAVQTYRLALVSVVAGPLGLVATSHGNRIASELPRDRRAPIVRGRALSADAIHAVDAAGQVTIRPTGTIREFDGYPPLSPALRTTLEEGVWRFPADLQLAELERRLERRLRTDHGLSLVEVSIDGRGRATIAAAPPANGVATTLPDGRRAVTVTGLVPTGLESGDAVAVAADETTVDGNVLAIDDDCESKRDHELAAPTADDETRRADAGTDAGTRRVTVAVETADAGTLLEAMTHRVAARPTGDNHAAEAATLLENAGRPVTALEPRDGEVIDPDDILGVRAGDGWTFAVDGAVPDGVDRAFVAGSAESVEEGRR